MIVYAVDPGWSSVGYVARHNVGTCLVHELVACVLQVW